MTKNFRVARVMRSNEHKAKDYLCWHLIIKLPKLLHDVHKSDKRIVGELLLEWVHW